MELGDYKMRDKEFIENGASGALAKIFKLTEDPLLKTNSVKLLYELATNSQKISQEIANIGIATVLSAEIIKNSKGVAQLSQYFERLLKLANELLTHHYGLEELGQSEVSDALFFALRTIDPGPVQKAILLLVPYLTQEAEQRKKLYESEGFSNLWNLFLDSIQNKNKDLMYKAIIALSNFTNDERTRLLIANSQKTYKTYKALVDCLDRTETVPTPTRLAAAGIVSRLCKLGAPINDLKEQISESGLVMALVRNLADDEMPIKKECLTALTHLEDFITKHADELELALVPLMNVLSSKDEEIVIPALKYLNTLAGNYQLIKKMIGLGMVTIVSSFVINDPKNISTEVLIAAGQLLLRLEDIDEARMQMLKSNIFYTVLPLVTFPNTKIRYFWYDAMADLCNHKEFRSQLENEPTYLGFIKKGLEVPEMEKGEEFIFTLRVIFQSKILLSYFVDEVTTSKLFDFYKNFTRDANKEFVIYMLESLELIAQNKEGRGNLMKNIAMLEVLVLCIQREAPEVSTLGARILLLLLETTTRKYKQHIFTILAEEQGVLKTTTLPEASVVLATNADPQCKNIAYNILLALLKEDIYTERLQYLGIKDADDVHQLTFGKGFKLGDTNNDPKYVPPTSTSNPQNQANQANKPIPPSQNDKKPGQTQPTQQNQPQQPPTKKPTNQPQSQNSVPSQQNLPGPNQSVQDSKK